MKRMQKDKVTKMDFGKMNEQELENYIGYQVKRQINVLSDSSYVLKDANGAQIKADVFGNCEAVSKKERLNHFIWFLDSIFFMTKTFGTAIIQEIDKDTYQIGPQFYKSRQRKGASKKNIQAQINIPSLNDQQQQRRSVNSDSVNAWINGEDQDLSQFKPFLGSAQSSHVVVDKQDSTQVVSHSDSVDLDSDLDVIMAQCQRIDFGTDDQYVEAQMNVVTPKMSMKQRTDWCKDVMSREILNIRKDQDIVERQCLRHALRKYFYKVNKEYVGEHRRADLERLQIHDDFDQPQHKWLRRDADQDYQNYVYASIWQRLACDFDKVDELLIWNFWIGQQRKYKDFKKWIILQAANCEDMKSMHMVSILLSYVSRQLDDAMDIAAVDHVEPIIMRFLQQDGIVPCVNKAVKCFEGTFMVEAQMAVPEENMNVGVDNKIEKNDTEGTTQFDQTGVVVKSQRKDFMDMSDSYLQSASTNYIQGLRDFLEKPVSIGQGTIDSTSNYNTILFQFQINKAALLAQTMWAQKIQGFTGIRFTSKMRIQLSANPFQQGRLMAYYIPMTDQCNTYFPRNQTLTAVTQLPHVEIDVNQDTEAVLEIPYVSNQTHLNLINGEGTQATFFLSIYFPLSTGSSGSTNVQYTIFWSLHDVDLVVPNIQAQMGGPNRRRSTRIAKREDVEVTQQEGSITKILGATQGVLSQFNRVPLIESYVRPLEWVTGIAKQLTGYFGWSKPVVVERNVRMNRTYNHAQQNCDVIDNCHQLSLFQSNKVQVMESLGGTKIDEMSIDYIKQISFYINNTGISTSNNPGDNLIRMDLGPLYIPNYSSSTGVYSMGPMNFLAQMFQGYRGGIIITLKFIKTEFHSAKISLSFLPGFNTRNLIGFGTTQTSNIASQQYLHREIIDIRHGSVFEFCFPYFSFQPYLPVEQPYGSMEMYVVNGLKAPATVAQSVGILIEARAAPDMEFYFPQQPRYYPTTVSAQMFAPDKQSADEQENVVKCKAIGQSQQNPEEQTLFAQYCIGEQVTSLKQLVLKGTVLASDTCSSRLFRPFAIGSLPLSTSGSTKQTWNPLDYYSIISSLYAFVRGSVVIKIASQITTTPNVIKTNLIPMNGNNITNVNVPTTVYAGSLNPVVFEDITGTMGNFCIPNYGQFHTRLVAPDNAGDSNVCGVKMPYNAQLMLQLTGAAATTNSILMRHGGDDYQAGFFLAVPNCQAFSG